MGSLRGKVAVVTGATRGIGKGIAVALGAAAATVYVTGRSLDPSDDPRGSLAQTAGEIDAHGGEGIALRCDHADDARVKQALARIGAKRGRLDVLVNNAMSTPQRRELPEGARSQWDLHPFWAVPVGWWDAFNNVGVRSHYVASAYAVPLMIATGGGLIVNITSSGAARYAQCVAYGVAKAATEKLAADMAEELRPHNVASVALWPGFTRTEDVLGQPDIYPDLSKTVSPRYNGLGVVALAADPRVMEKTGKRLKISELAAEYGFSDPDPVPSR
ncbi:MAG TPA: SDR family NAD(P)-dependent oxidoreductase [Casimicrobiaceae bacterium]|nr:SDR family NAD(P)-dependent oxidoreductase [Casimicrobiaceae bacterium]